MKSGLSALCKRGLSVRAGALRVVLREALSRQTAPKHKCSSKINEDYDVNDGRKPNRKTVLQKGRKGMSYYLKCLPAEDTSVGFWQNKRTLQRKSEKCCVAKYSTVSPEIICVHNFQRLEQKDMKMSTAFFLPQTRGIYFSL